MKRKRVVISSAVLAAFLAAFFFLPLPVSRVREVGVVQISEGFREFVHVHETGILAEVLVHDGQTVARGADLGRFRNPRFDFEQQQYETEYEAASQQAAALEARLTTVVGTSSRLQLEKDLGEARAARDKAKGLLERQVRLIADSEVLKAPRAGTVMSVPKKEDMLRTWDKGESPPFCSIGDPKRLRLLVPVSATEYREIRQNLEKARETRPDATLDVTILPKYRHDLELIGRIVKLPDTDEKNVPVALTHGGGGSLATKPGGDPNVNAPLAQTYLIPVEIDDPDETLAPGTLAAAKIHLEWRSAAWWAWRSIASALDVGLW